MKVAKCNEKLQRKFLWSGIGEEHKFHLVNWAQNCEPVRFGGLHVRNLRRFNQALLGNWLCSYGIKREHLRRRILRLSMGMIGGGGAMLILWWAPMV